MEIVQFFFSHLSGQKGRRRWAVAFFLGILASGAMAPVYAVFLLIPSLVGLIWLTYDNICLREAFFVGWWFGFGHFVIGLYWVANAFFVQPQHFGWMAPFAVFALAGILALFPAVTVVASRSLGYYSSGVGRVLVFAAIWVLFEWVRSWVFTGFPWNLIGSVWTFSDSIIQFAAFWSIEVGSIF